MLLSYIFTELWSSHACQKCQVKGQLENVVITSFYVLVLIKAAAILLRLFHSVLLS